MAVDDSPGKVRADGRPGGSVPIVRKARREDLPFLPAVERDAAAAFAPYLREMGLSAALLDTVTSLEELRHAQRAGQLWVAAVDDVPVGFALVCELGGFAHLEEMDVLPRHAGRGIGSLLLQAVSEAAMRAGLPGVTLSTFRDVPWNAPFYERRGFVIVAAGELSDEHARLREAEASRGLRPDLRVMMVHRFA